MIVTKFGETVTEFYQEKPKSCLFIPSFMEAFVSRLPPQNENNQVSMMLQSLLDEMTSHFNGNKEERISSFLITSYFSLMGGILAKKNLDSELVSQISQLVGHICSNLSNQVENSENEEKPLKPKVIKGFILIIKKIVDQLKDQSETNHDILRESIAILISSIEKNLSNFQSYQLSQLNNSIRRLSSSSSSSITTNNEENQEMDEDNQSSSNGSKKKPKTKKSKKKRKNREKNHLENEDVVEEVVEEPPMKKKKKKKKKDKKITKET